MLTAVLGVSSAAALVLLLGLTCRIYRRLKRLETQQQARATMRQIINTPPPDGGCGLADELQPPRPARRRCHLSLYRGGGAAAALIAIGVTVRATAAYMKHSTVAGATAATVAAAGVATAVYVAPSPGGEPIAQPTATAASPALPPVTPGPPRKPNPAPSAERSDASAPEPSATKPPRPTSPPTAKAPRPSVPPTSTAPRRNLPSHRDLPAEVGVTVAPRDPEKAPLVEADVQDARLCVRANALKLVAAKVCAGR